MSQHVVSVPEGYVVAATDPFDGGAHYHLARPNPYIYTIERAVCGGDVRKYWLLPNLAGGARGAVLPTVPVDCGEGGVGGEGWRSAVSEAHVNPTRVQIGEYLLETWSRPGEEGSLYVNGELVLVDGKKKETCPVCGRVWFPTIHREYHVCPPETCHFCGLSSDTCTRDGWKKHVRWCARHPALRSAVRKEHEDWKAEAERMAGALEVRDDAS